MYVYKVKFSNPWVFTYLYPKVFGFLSPILSIFNSFIHSANTLSADLPRRNVPIPCHQWLGDKNSHKRNIGGHKLILIFLVGCYLFVAKIREYLSCCPQACLRAWFVPSKLYFSAFPQPISPTHLHQLEEIREQMRQDEKTSGNLGGKKKQPTGRQVDEKTELTILLVEFCLCKEILEPSEEHITSIVASSTVEKSIRNLHLQGVSIG